MAKKKHRLRDEKKPLFSEKEASYIIRQLLMAVSYLHSNKVMHRDIKPENIMLSYRKTLDCKLIDFAAATDFKEDEHDNEIPLKEVKGTSYYIAPEVISGSYTSKCDMWSIGVILYMLLTGNPPFDGRSDKDVIKQLIKKAPKG